MLHCPRSVARTIVYSGIILATGVNLALAADPTGDWKVADGVANIRVAQCNGNMWGVVAWEKVPGGKDKNNPDTAKQSRPTLGMPILIDMKKKPGVDAWSITPRTDKTTVRPSSRLGPTSSRFKAAYSAFCAVAKPGPVSVRRSPQAPPTAWPGARQRVQPVRRPRPQLRHLCRRRRRPRVRPILHLRRRPRPVRSRRRPRLANPPISAISAYFPTSRGLPISAGWNNSTAASVMTNDSASNLPMLAVPG